ncbi:MAG TPA: metallophosphoesterase [Abditibacteriaceae bacterium]|nr:metallophosphoesterase [Abditibacteriaceae bacterium]
MNNRNFNARAAGRGAWISTALLLTVAVYAALSLRLSTQAAPTSVTLTRGPYVQSTTPTSAYIVWKTSIAASSSVTYRLARGDGIPPGVIKVGKPLTVVGTEKVKQHVVRLTGLRPGSSYLYQVSSGGRPLKNAMLRTAKLPGQPFTFAVWGDSGHEGSRGQKPLAAQIKKSNPDFMLHTGDLIYPRGEAARFDPYFFQVYAPTLARAPFYGSLGNHDIGTANGRPFLENFVLPRNGPPRLAAERNYAFDYSDAHVVVIDSNLGAYSLRRDVAPWLEKNLKASRARWKFVVFHHPPFSSGLHGDDARIKNILVPIFSRCQVDVVFNGHDHHYERFKPRDGVLYIVTGAGGAGRYPRRRHRATTARYWNDDWSFTRIDIKGRTLHGRQIAASGATVDDWSIKK